MTKSALDRPAPNGWPRRQLFRHERRPFTDAERAIAWRLASIASLVEIGLPSCTAAEAGTWPAGTARTAFSRFDAMAAPRRVATNVVANVHQIQLNAPADADLSGVPPAEPSAVIQPVDEEHAAPERSASAARGSRRRA
jgi:hypothetical protein